MIRQVLSWIMLAPWRWWQYRWDCFREEERNKKDKQMLVDEWKKKIKK